MHTFRTLLIFATTMLVLSSCSAPGDTQSPVLTVSDPSPSLEYPVFLLENEKDSSLNTIGVWSDKERRMESMGTLDGFQGKLFDKKVYFSTRDGRSVDAYLLDAGTVRMKIDGPEFSLPQEGGRADTSYISDFLPTSDGLYVIDCVTNQGAEAEKCRMLLGGANGTIKRTILSDLIPGKKDGMTSLTFADRQPGYPGKILLVLGFGDAGYAAISTYELDMKTLAVIETKDASYSAVCVSGGEPPCTKEDEREKHAFEELRDSLYSVPSNGKTEITCGPFHATLQYQSDKDSFLMTTVSGKQIYQVRKYLGCAQL